MSDVILVPPVGKSAWKVPWEYTIKEERDDLDRKVFHCRVVNHDKGMYSECRVREVTLPGGGRERQMAFGQYLEKLQNRILKKIEERDNAIDRFGKT